MVGGGSKVRDEGVGCAGDGAQVRAVRWGSCVSTVCTQSTHVGSEGAVSTRKCGSGEGGGGESGGSEGTDAED